MFQVRQHASRSTNSCRQTLALFRRYNVTTLMRDSVCSSAITAKPVIMVLTQFYLPGYKGGGPIRSIANMIERLSGDFEFHIFTSDRDLHDQQPYPDVKVDSWNAVGKAKVFYAGPLNRSLFGIVRFLRRNKFDLIYLNSFFDSGFTISPLVARRLNLIPHRPCVLAPRGEFSEGAFDLKIWKKRPFVAVARRFRLYDGLCWQASTDYEKQDICSRFGSRESDVRVVSNIVVAPDLTAEFLDDASLASGVRHPNDALRVCFLSRISPKKNLDFALKVLARVTVPVHFTVYGPQENSVYWQVCANLIAQMPPHVKVVYRGSLPHSEVRAAIAESDLFFLPTLGENFGHVFLEAWSVGVPVLISDQTPWLGLEQRQLGWEISLDCPDKFVQAVEAAAKFDSGYRNSVRESCRAFAREIADDADAVAANRELFAAAFEIARLEPNPSELSGK